MRQFVNNWPSCSKISCSLHFFVTLSMRSWTKPGQKSSPILPNDCKSPLAAFAVLYYTIARAYLIRAMKTNRRYRKSSCDKWDMTENRLSTHLVKSEARQMQTLRLCGE